ncbi:MAG: cytochrome d ubiquinol oxidase subunit II [Coriobacteriales bacterium]|nr:cytochrome d ubiquinol oxidase subunit II [Coriobacteriales bacterium]
MMLATIWFLLVGVLIVGYAVFDGFDLGVGTLYPFLGRSESDKAMMREAVGPVWDGNEVWLLTAGGALFAAFPPVYATVFSGFYLALMLVLFALIFRAASLEFRHSDPAWATLWDWAFFVGSALPALLFGVAAGNIIRGVPLDTAGEYAGTFFTLLNPYALIIGVLGLTWILLHGSSWLAVKSTGDLYARTVAVRRIMLLVVPVMLVIATAATAFLAPRAFALAMSGPVGWIFIVVALAGVGAAWMSVARDADLPAFYGSALTAVGMVGIWAASIFPALVPSLGPGESLTVANASSSQLTLTVMLIIAAIGVPLVLFYFFLIYKTYAGKIETTDSGAY